MFSKDDSKILTFGEKSIDVWSVKKDKKLFTINIENIAMVKYSSDGSKIIAVTKDNKIKIWDNKGKEIISIDTESMANEVMFSRDRLKLIFWTDKKATIYDIKNKNEILNVRADIFKSDGITLACAIDNIVKFFNIANSKELFNIYHQGNIQNIVLNKNKIITFDNKDVRYWQKLSTSNNGSFLDFKLKNKKDFILSDEADKVVSLTKNFFLLHYNNSPKKAIWFKHKNSLGVDFSSNDSKILSFNKNSIIVWNRAKRVKIKTMNTGQGSLKKVLFWDEKNILVQKKNSISVLNIKTKERVFKKIEDNIEDIKVGQKQIAVIKKNNIIIIDKDTKELVKIPRAKIGNFYFSIDGEKFFVTDDNNIKIYSSKTKKLLQTINSWTKNLISNSNLNLFLGFDKNQVSLYNEDGKVLISYIHKDDILGVKFNKNEDSIISYSKGAVIKKIKLYNPKIENSSYITKTKIQSGTKLENGRIIAISDKEWNKLRDTN